MCGVQQRLCSPSVHLPRCNDNATGMSRWQCNLQCSECRPPCLNPPWLQLRDAGRLLRHAMQQVEPALPLSQPLPQRLRPGDGARARGRLPVWRILQCRQHDVSRQEKDCNGTCNVGSLGHYATDAATYANMSMDFMKMDRCSASVAT